MKKLLIISLLCVFIFVACNERIEPDPVWYKGVLSYTATRHRDNPVYPDGHTCICLTLNELETNKTFVLTTDNCLLRGFPLKFDGHTMEYLDTITIYGVPRNYIPIKGNNYDKIDLKSIKEVKYFHFDQTDPQPIENYQIKVVKLDHNKAPRKPGSSLEVYAVGGYNEELNETYLLNIKSEGHFHLSYFNSSNYHLSFNIDDILSVNGTLYTTKFEDKKYKVIDIDSYQVIEQ